MSINVALTSLGCAKNTVDAELMLGLLKKTGYKIVDRLAIADIVIVNTCGFIIDAKEESIEAIFSAVGLKKRNKRPYILVAGCLSQRYGKILFREIPEVDGIMGINRIADISIIVKRILNGERVLAVDGEDYLCEDQRLRLLNNTATAYVKISEGCDNRCSYCVIPGIRGPFRSRQMESVIDEVYYLANNGVKEIILVAQDTTRYGLDIYGQYKLAGLLRQLVNIDGLQWIRLLYCYPTAITPELIQVIAREDKICKYIDLPLQHVSNKLLRLMNRQGYKEDYLDLIKKMRAKIPGLTLRTTFMVGFPGETNAEFMELLDFIKEVKFERMGVFTYSREEGTPASLMPGQVPEEVKRSRLQKAMMLQQQISYTINCNKIGRNLEVLVEGFDEELQKYKGRSQSDAPEIDGQVYFNFSGHIDLGSIVVVRINQADEYDLTGELVHESAKQAFLD